jgi:hypothetical protein
MTTTPMIHELLGRDIDPIDDVTRQFERYYTEDYFDPVNGDWISDDYKRIIDHTTKPGQLSSREATDLIRSINRLNGKPKILFSHLGHTGLLDTYNSVAEQITGINASDPDRDEIPGMRPVLIETDE